MIDMINKMYAVPDDAIIIRSEVKPPTIIIVNDDGKKHKRHAWNRTPYSEVVNFLESIGYTILISEEEYKGVNFSFPALCARGHETKVRFHHLKNGSSCCRKCGRIKTKEVWLEKYGVDNPLRMEETQEKRKQTMIEKYGVDHASKIPGIMEKRKETCMKRYGVDNPLKDPEIKERYKQNMLEKYGVDNPMKDPEIKERYKQNMLEKYGVSAPIKIPDVMNKIQQTNLQRYGVTNPNKNPEIRNKGIRTLIERYGVAHPFHHPEFYEKAKQTFMENYGVENPLQNAEIFAKQQESAFGYKEYIFPSGKIAKCQGYEPFCLNDLLKEGYEEEQIVAGTLHSNMPEIWYMIGDRKHRYYPDIFIPDENLIIEVKSTYTFEKELELNLIKEEACKQLGYNFSFRIYSGKGELLESTI